MPSPYEAQLRTRANSFIQNVLAKQNYQAKIDDLSFEEYSVELQFGNAGKAKLFYSPKRDYYTLTVSKLDSVLAPKITNLWDTMLSDEAKPSVLKAAQTPYQAFVDGSYDTNRQVVGYGAVILNQGNEVQRLSGIVEKYTDSRQIGGELSATMRVVQWCKQNKVEDIDIFYDYEGIEKWATGRWKTKETISQEYAKYMKEAKINIHWHKVDSHTGVHWNEVADKLAKHGARDNEPKNPQPSPVMLLEAIGEAFATHLNDNGYQAQFDDVKNNQYARIIIYNSKKVVGFFDLYNTKKRPLDPYLHGFDDKKLVSEIEALWIVYKMQL